MSQIHPEKPCSEGNLSRGHTAPTRADKPWVLLCELTTWWWSPAGNLSVLVAPSLREEAEHREKGGGPRGVGWEQ